MKKHAALIILVTGSICVLALWWWYGMLQFGRPVEKWGVFGDKFGALNCLFTGLAFVGLVAAFWHERQQSNAREEEHRTASKARDREHVQILDGMRYQYLASTRATKLQAMIARADGLRYRISQINSIPSQNPFAENVGELLAELKTLESEIRELSNRDWTWERAM